jgi:precorrin-4/cobalt-precorrin-4 C11-methyltransferase
MREQMDLLDEMDIPYEVCPGVSAFSAGAAALDLVYTLPGISQTVIITRAEGRTAVPEKEKLRALAAHGSTMVLFLSAGMTEKVSRELIEGGYRPDTPAALVYKASWPEEKTAVCTLETLAETAEKEGIRNIALIIVGDAVAQKGYLRSKLYDPSFTTEYRIGNRKGTGG